MPQTCPNVPAELLNPRNTWANTAEYDQKANHLAELFNKNFKQYADGCSEEILAAAPKAVATA
jgi:phosphoenolpyruvate carboxykinase (ATP)